VISKPGSAEDFLRRPTRSQWLAALRTGWTGPDGSSCSFDVIQGVRIGRSGPGFEHAHLPANRHDWFYELGRRFGLPESYRRLADLDYRESCKDTLRSVLEGPSLWFGLLRCHLRYVALRLGGRRAWRGGSR
jgi:hypothetical protein